MAEEKPGTDPVATGALVGAPVDERKPAHLSRDQYLEKNPGRHTRQFMVDAGIAKRRSRTRALVLAATVAVLAIGALVMMLP